MKRTILTVSAVMLILASGSFLAAMGSPDEVAVLVNGEALSTWEVGLLLPQIRNEMGSQGLDTKNSELVRIALQRGIDNLLMVQEARGFGIETNQDRVREKMDRMAEAAGGAGALEAELIKSGVTYEQLRETAVKADLVQTLVETRIVASIEVSDEDVRAFYDENPELFTTEDKIHSRHILFVVKPDAGPEEKREIRKRAELAHARAISGESFAALARELSEGPNAARGGDLGFTARGQMVSAFDDAVWALEPGEISDVVESPLGYHVIKVDEIVIGEAIPFDEARPLVTDFIRQQRSGQAIAAHITELRQAAEITDPKE